MNDYRDDVGLQRPGGNNIKRTGPLCSIEKGLTNSNDAITNIIILIQRLFVKVMYGKTIGSKDHACWVYKIFV